MINLCLVVIANQFSETRRRETAKMKQEREEFSSDSSLSSLTDRSVTNEARSSVVNGQLFCSETEDTNLYRDIINLVHYYIRRLYHRSRKFRRVSHVSSGSRHDCFILQVRRARLLEDKEDELLHRVEIETNLKVVKEVSVHAAVNDDGE